MNDEELILFRAMQEAERAFKKYLTKFGYDPAYFDLHLEGYLLGSEFERLKKITISNSL